MRARARCRLEFESPIPTALSDSGHKSRTSNTKPVFFHRLAPSLQAQRATGVNWRSARPAFPETSRWSRLKEKTSCNSACVRTTCDWEMAGARSERRLFHRNSLSGRACEVSPGTHLERLQSDDSGIRSEP